LCQYQLLSSESISVVISHSVSVVYLLTARMWFESCSQHVWAVCT